MLPIGAVEVITALLVFIDTTWALAAIATVLGGAVHAHAVLQKEPVATLLPALVFGVALTVMVLQGIHWACVVSCVPFGFVAGAVLHSVIGTPPKTKAS